MTKVMINKEQLLPQFVSGNITSFGEAAGSLKLCGLRLYIYLMCNADGFDWRLNPAAYANWLGVENSRGVRKAIDDGLKDLVNNGFAKLENVDEYSFFEKRIKVELTVPKMEQIVPKVEPTVPNQEQTVPPNIDTLKFLGF